MPCTGPVQRARVTGVNNNIITDSINSCTNTINSIMINTTTAATSAGPPAHWAGMGHKAHGARYTGPVGRGRFVVEFSNP